MLATAGIMFSCSGKDQDKMFAAAEDSAKHQQWTAAAEGYRTLVLEFPTGKHASESLFKIGMIQYNQLKDLPAAAATMEQVATRYQESPEAPKALMTLGFLYGNESTVKNTDSAKKYYQQLLDHYPKDPLAEAASSELHFLDMPPDEQLHQSQTFDEHALKRDSVIKPPTPNALAH